MVTERTCRLLHFFRRSVKEEGEELFQARRFIEKLDELNESEQLVLGCALKSRENLSQFSAAFKVR